LSGGFVTEVELVRAKIRDGQKQRWLDWCEELKRRGPEVMKTLENEGVLSEACFLSSDEQYVYYFMEASDLKKAHSSPHEFRIDEEHRLAWRTTLESPEKTKILFNFHRP
jgi:hypothetical protein